MTSTVANYSKEESYLIYKLWNQGFISGNQIKDTGLKQICRSSAAAEFGLNDSKADEILETLKRDGVIEKYQSGRPSWSLNHSFVQNHKDELQEMKAEKAGVDRIMGR